ncbi:vesicle-associated membrane protein 721-like isoform X1 [Panicum virgatum]|uniref:vesicle-associated membrane protein 721-like isoform X1 n=1 Tax=Panicum virgatum TaxID=38727 RepID=UPI0019D6343F|nr:vesicle-associated membrane protein 721-like isoform X1 [Panicum virgatum]
MAQPPEGALIYAMVARGTVVVAEHTSYAGNFRDIAAQCLHRLPAGNNRFTYTCDAHTFNFLVADGYAYCVVATESAGRQIPMAFLEMIKEDFNKRYAGGKAATATANSLSRDFGPRLGDQMQYCRDHPEEVSRLSRVKAQVDQVKGIMMENIDKVIDRGEQIDGLVTRTEQLHDQAARRAGASQDVVPEHEDQAHRSRHRHRAHPHHNPLNLPWHMQVIHLAQMQ